MPTDEVSQDDSAAMPRTKTGPRHAAPKKPLSTRFHVPAGRAVAFAAMPTAVIMGIGFTATLANADDQPSTSKSLTAEEYQACVELLAGEDASASASPSASASASASASESADETEPSPSATPSSGTGEAPSSDSGSDDEAEPTPSASKTSQSSGSAADTATATPSASESTSNPLDPLGIGDALKDILTPDETASATPTPSATPSASASEDTSGSDSSDTATDTAEKPAKDTTDTASKAAEGSTKASKEPADEATSSASPSPSPSASASTDAADCPVSTDAEGNVDNPVILPDDPWYLNASSLLLKGADYQGVVQVKTADGTVKKVLKYVISGGTDIGDLHQTVIDKHADKTYHVQAGKGTTSTIRDGDTVMYTESISGKLFGLIPITFDPEHPPPLNIPLIYFTDVKVVQAGQFGGTLTIPSMHTYQD
ncbi:hypothetical protein ACIPC1_07015 [Streptomyces sp. NPDC087263]|uniref:hypothetical protein n=1 Tax=Streptomyces sp. NPDC087263 TaxID=3365773 RepID=UPI0038087766